MNTDCSVYCDADRCVGDEVSSDDYARLVSDVEGDVGIGYGEWFEL